MSTQKIYAGSALRDLRKQLNLTQREFAKRLGVSISYLNQMENNNRPLAAAVMLTLARDFGYDLASLSGGDTTRLVADMQEALADPLFNSNKPSTVDLNLIAANAPAMARAFLDLHRGYLHQVDRLSEIDLGLGSPRNPQPWEEVRDFFHYTDNYIDAIDRAGEKFAMALPNFEQNPLAAANRWFENQGIALQTSMGGDLRRYDADARVLHISSTAARSTQLFQTLYQIGILNFDELFDATLDLAQFCTDEARRICKIGLANYFAGAVAMPYGHFSTAAGELRHDLVAMAARFGCSIEQVAHRLSTLQRSGAKGIPFFFVRVDQAGTITKRHSATKLQFARFGGACPLWNVHRAFETPGQFLRQLAETPDGGRYFCLARDVSKQGDSFHAPTRRYAIGLGCEIEHSGSLVYADDLDAGNPAAFEPIGVSCRICPRENCHQRSLPPMGRETTVDPSVRGVLPYRI